MKSVYKIETTFIICLLSFLCLLNIAGCRKDRDISFEPPVAVNHAIVQVADTAGNTRILVYAKEGWKASILENDVNWARIVQGSGNGQGEFFVEFDSNVGNLPRLTKILVEGGNKKDTIILQQRGISTTIDIKDSALIAIAAGGRMKTGIVLNMPLDLITVDIKYDNGVSEGWVHEIDIEDMTSLVFKLDRTNSETIRSAVIKFTYLDALGKLNQDSLIVRQRPRAGNDSDEAELRDISYVKTVLPAGTITENIYIEGVVISEKGNPNLATNLNTSAAIVSPRENQVSFYVQDPEGRFGGILFKSKAPGENILDRNERVKIWLKGATLNKYTNPTRIVIENLDTDYVLEKNESDPVMPKELYMKDLTDNDIYTLVKLKDVEIAISNGAFSNIHEGYRARTSVYPNCIRDVNRNNMYMLINHDVPYRRDGNGVPRGSGTITGILVHDHILRYGGNIGRYSIRPQNRADIALAESRDNGFTRVIAEWSEYKTGTSDPLSPDIGHEYKAKMSHSSRTIGSGPDFNGLTTAGSGLINTGGFSVAAWWNATAGHGESWIFELSTLGLTKPLSMQLEGDVIVGGPRNHVLEWAESLSAATWNLIGEYTLQDYVRAGNETLYTQVPGHKVVDFALPNELLNKEMIYIRARVKNNEAGTNTSDTGGTILASAASRLGHVSIKENK